MERNPYAPPSSATQVVPEILPGTGPAGLSGWLVLVGLGLVVTPLRLASYVLQTLLPMFSDGTWHVLTTPGSANYHPLWGPWLLAEIVINLFFVAASLYLLFLFFRKSWRFPKLYVGYLIANLLFVVADAFAVQFVLPDRPILDPETMRDLIRSLVGVALWVPYVFLSRRVKNTFVRIDA